MLPKRAHVEHIPIDLFRSGVGKSSAVYTYTEAKAADAPNLPTVDKAVITHLVPEMCQ
jgi:hypothetical protein